MNVHGECTGVGRMLLIIIALFWVAILAPVAVKHFRDSGTEKSINLFHAEHEVLARQNYAVEPAHRLHQADSFTSKVRGLLNQPHFTAVHADGSRVGSEIQREWQDWDENYDNESNGSIERYQSPGQSLSNQYVIRSVENRYASAYASTPREDSYDARSVNDRYQAPQTRNAMQLRRKKVFSRLLISALVLSVLDFMVGFSLFQDLAILAWIGVIGFVAMAFYSVSQGYLSEESLPIRLPKMPQLPQFRPLATVETLYDEAPQQFDSEFYEPEADDWRHEAPRRAHG
jgi:hypothetical protein